MSKTYCKQLENKYDKSSKPNGVYFVDMLKLALTARLPFISVTTDDQLYSGDVLSFIAETKAVPWYPEGDDPKFPSADVMYTSVDCASAKLYFALEEANKTLVFFNVKPSAMHFVGGVLLPPKKMLEKVLTGLLKTSEKVQEVLSAFGGLTLKDVHEVLRLTEEEFGEITAAKVNRVREGYLSKLKGMVQVSTEQEFYQVPSYLQDWLDGNLSFLKTPVHPTLTPRGLLFDGPPGTGKSAAAKCIAKALGVPLFRIDIGAMKGKYVGDSEGNLLAALRQVDQMEPCVVMLDESEKMFGEQSDSGVTSSMLSSLLWWLQEHRSRVFTVMTTNKKAAIPPELYREGRIDEVMTFNGLETDDQIIEFAQIVAENMLEKLGCPDKIGNIMYMMKIRAKSLATSGATPQSKVTQIVHNMVKAALLEEKKS